MQKRKWLFILHKSRFCFFRNYQKDVLGFSSANLILLFANNEAFSILIIFAEKLLSDCLLIVSFALQIYFRFQLNRPLSDFHQHKFHLQ